MNGVIVGQSGGPTAVINSSLAGVICGAKENGASKILGMKHGIQGLLRGEIVDLNERFSDERDIESLKRTPAAFLGSCRFKLPNFQECRDDYVKIVQILEKLGVDSFFYIGGNDSMDTIQKLSDFAKEEKCTIKFVGVPKTIDNDLALTDHTPGFGSAAKFIATTVRELVCDCSVYDVPAVTIVEIMGRNAGWLTASAALAKTENGAGADLIYLPEIPFSVENFLSRVESLTKSKKTVVVVVSEGIRTAEGKFVCELSGVEGKTDAFGHSMLSGAAKYLENRVIRAFPKLKCRSIEFSTLQRCAAHCMSKTDLEESFLCGKEAVNAAVRGESGRVVVLERTSAEPYSCKAQTQDVHKIANFEKKVPLEWIFDGGVTAEAISYIRPLILGEVSQQMENGIPSYIHL